MSFKIVITDNENGKEIVNNDNVKAIIGAFADDEKNAQMCFCKANSQTLTSAVVGARKVISKIINENPEIKIFTSLEELFGKIAEDKE